LAIKLRNKIIQLFSTNAYRQTNASTAIEENRTWWVAVKLKSLSRGEKRCFIQQLSCPKVKLVSAGLKKGGNSRGS
jgi:hypothetical protein